MPSEALLYHIITQAEFHNRLLSGGFFIPTPLNNNDDDFAVRAILIHTILSFSLFLIIATFQPISAQEQIRLRAVTDQGTFRVELIWTPNDISRANTFEIHFIDPETGIEIEDVKYDISIYRDGRPEISRTDQVSTFQEVFFEEAGSYEIRIEDIEDLGEGVIVPIQVTPEFQSEVFLLFIASFGIAIVVARIAGGNNLFRHTVN